MKKIGENLGIIETTELLSTNPWRTICCFVTENIHEMSEALCMDYTGNFHLIGVRDSMADRKWNPFSLSYKHLTSKYNVYQTEGFIPT